MIHMSCFSPLSEVSVHQAKDIHLLFLQLRY